MLRSLVVYLVTDVSCQTIFKSEAVQEECPDLYLHNCVPICCDLDGKMHIFATTQRDGPYEISS